MAANNPPLSTLFHGSVTVENGCDTTLYGNGDISIYNSAYIGYGNQVNSTSPSTGSMVVYGGLGILQDSNLGSKLTVQSTSNLQTTNINTSLGGFNVSGGNSVSFVVGNGISFISTGGNAILSSSSANVIISSGYNVNNAIQITNTNAGGGTVIQSGQNSGIVIGGGSGGINENTSGGNIILTSNNGSTSIIVNASAGNQNLTLAQYGTNQLSGVVIVADGAGQTGNSSIEINSRNTGGNISIINNTVGSGSIINYAGSGGYSVTTNTGGSIGLTANGANSFFLVNSTGGSGQTLTIGITGGNLINDKLILTSDGTNPTQAILIQTSNTNGGIMINQPALSQGGVVINTGSSGLSANTQSGGGINFLANGASSSFINSTTASGQNLRICVEGTTGSSLILCSEGTGPNAIQINSTGNSGGIMINSNGPININSSDSTTGINIGTINSNPVNIGSVTSTTTILGDLNVQGTTTTVESTVVQIADNIIQLNNGPAGTADGGIAIAQYQPANNACQGDVVAGMPESVGYAQSSSFPGTIILSSLDTASDNYYNGYWIKIFPTDPNSIACAGACQVRRIKSYTASTKTALLYTTADQTGLLNNPSPIQGLDLVAPLNSTSYYGVYGCAWILSIWDSINNEWALACSPMSNTSAQPPISSYINLQINNLKANAITVNSINNTIPDIQITFNLSDNTTALYELSPTNLSPGTSFPYPYGLYIMFVRPLIATNSRCSAIFLMGSLGNGQCGMVSRLVSVKGLSGEQLDCTWLPSGGGYDGYPSILYRPAPGTGTTTSYTAKIVSV
jgi:hypothetical protein